MTRVQNRAYRLSRRVYVTLSPRQWILLLLPSVFVVGASQDPLLTAACLLALPLGATMLWRQAEPPILFAAFVTQWLQISTGVFLSSSQGVDLRHFYGVYSIDTATWASLAGLMVLALGMRSALRGHMSTAYARLLEEVRLYDVQKVGYAYLIAFGATLLIQAYAWLIPGLGQALYALVNFRWAFFFVLTVTVLLRRQGMEFLWLAVAIELIKGFTSYFSEYREVFFFLALALFTARARIDGRTLGKVLLVMGAVLVLSAWWSVVKQDYRDFLSGGTGKQIVLVDPVDRIAKVVTLIEDAGVESIPEGLVSLANRVAYTEYFGRALDWVPSVHPHTDGKILTEAVRHIFTPRLFFPDKPALTPDVLNLERFTGLRIIEQGGRDTEVPIGYMAECYVDFGASGMFVPIFILGLLYGLAYRYFVTRPRYLLFSYGACAASLQVATQYGLTLVKILGGGLTVFIVMLFAVRFLVPRVHGLLLRRRAAHTGSVSRRHA